MLTCDADSFIMDGLQPSWNDVPGGQGSVFDIDFDETLDPSELRDKWIESGSNNWNGDWATSWNPFSSEMNIDQPNDIHQEGQEYSTFQISSPLPLSDNLNLDRPDICQQETSSSQQRLEIIGDANPGRQAVIGHRNRPELSAPSNQPPWQSFGNLDIISHQGSHSYQQPLEASANVNLGQPNIGQQATQNSIVPHPSLQLYCSPNSQDWSQGPQICQASRWPHMNPSAQLSTPLQPQAFMGVKPQPGPVTRISSTTLPQPGSPALVPGANEQGGENVPRVSRTSPTISHLHNDNWAYAIEVWPAFDGQGNCPFLVHFPHFPLCIRQNRQNRQNQPYKI
ncbi:hypothetical protein GGR54DRAFT_539856 [Hypoxylon sp. NC1633]|nr:hypothetical protein GGR54DRAFT_539856 [Hypoxylon sp. NC1633]